MHLWIDYGALLMWRRFWEYPRTPCISGDTKTTVQRADE
jgi:hypothetical protein